MGNFLNTDFSDLEDNDAFHQQRKENVANVMKDIVEEKKRKAAISERNLLRITRLRDSEYACGPLIRQCMSDLAAVAEGGGAAWAATAVLGSQLAPYVNARVYDWVRAISREGHPMEGTMVSGKDLAVYEDLIRRDTQNSEREPIMAYCYKIAKQYEMDRRTATMDASGWEIYADMEAAEEGDEVEQDVKFRMREKLEDRYRDPTRFGTDRGDFTLEGMIRRYCTPPRPRDKQLEMYAARKKISFEQALKLASKAIGTQSKVQKRAQLAEMLIKEFTEGVAVRHGHLGDYLPSWLAARVMGKLQEHCERRLEKLDERILIGSLSDEYLANDNSDALIYQHWSQAFKEELVRLLPDVELQGAELD